MEHVTDTSAATAHSATPSARLYVGLDVHKDTVAIAIARRALASDAVAVEDRGTIPNNLSRLLKVLEALHAEFDTALHVVYEAGPCGYVIWRRLHECGYSCDVIAPSLTPRQPGERVKTDRLDARKLARYAMYGYLTPVWVPDATQEAIRDLVRLRFDVKRTMQQHRQRLNLFVMRHGHQWSRSRWTKAHYAWLLDLKFNHPAQQVTLRASLDTLADIDVRLTDIEHELERHLATWSWQPVVQSLRSLRGIDQLAALTLVAELGDIRRFNKPPALMSYLGLTPSEHSSGGRRHVGEMTKTGNSVARRILVESAWTYRFPPRQTHHLQRKSRDASDYAKARAWDAQKRLCNRYTHMIKHGKNAKSVVTAIARELAGFVWDIAQHELARLETPPTH